jgi:gamma-glutamylcyclotransferase (GGCT)/AIG2-like uncharacterized protein YtfP
MLNNIFVYGTLMEGKWNDERLYDAVGKYRVSVLKGTIAGRIYAVHSFPGVKINDVNSIVHGEVHTFPKDKMAAVLKACDRLEGYVEGGNEENNFYNRRIVPVTLESGETVDAYVYEYAKKVEESIRITDGRWTEKSLEQIQHRNKKSMAAGR